MNRSILFLALLIVSGACNRDTGRTETTTTGPATSEATTSRKATVYVSFLGNVAFTKGPTNNSLDVLLPDARNEPASGTSTKPKHEVPVPGSSPQCRIPIPDHEAIVSIVPPEDLEVVPDWVPWVLDEEDIVITATGPDSPIPYGPAPGAAPMSSLGVTLDPALVNFATSPWPDRLVGRVRVSDWNEVKPYSTTTSAEFRKLGDTTGTPTATVTDPSFGVTYRIQADKITITRSSDGDFRVLQCPGSRGCRFHVVVANFPVQNAHPACGILPSKWDTHFDWLYEIAATPPNPVNRIYPLFPPVQTPRNPCMGGNY